MTTVFGASKGLIKKFGLSKAMFVGKTEEDDFFVDSIKPHVVFICGARGSGKSYTMGVLIEELAYKNDAVASIVIDPIGVFWSMRSPNKVEKELETLKEWEMEPRGFDNIQVLVPIGAKNLPAQSFHGHFSFRPSELRASDWAFSFGIERFSPAGLLIDSAIQKSGENYTIDDLIRVITTDPELQSKEKGFSKQTRRGIMSRLESSKYWGIFSDKATPIEKLARPGKVTIIDISFLEEAVGALVVGIIARKSLTRRKLESRNEALGKPVSFPPIWLFIDEAHTLVPKDRKTAASDNLIEYVKQGRKPGCSIVLATQQPSAINSEVLSQLDIMLVHQLVFEDDIKAVKKRMPAAMPKDWGVNFIRKLKTGQAVVGDRETTGTALISARPRMSQHEGRSALAIVRPQPVLDIEEDIEETNDENIVDEKEKEPEPQGRKIPVVKHKLHLEDAEKIAAKEIKKFLFIKREGFDVKMNVYWPFWHITAVGLEGNTEFLFDSIFGEIEGSRGLQRILDLSPLAAKILTTSGTLEMVAKKCGADIRTVKLQMNRLMNLGLMGVRGSKNKNYYPKRVKFPVKLDEFEGKIRDEPPEGRMMKPVIDPDKKLFKLLGLKLIDKELVYVPFALFRKTTGKQVWVNLASGEIEKRKIKLKI